MMSALDRRQFLRGAALAGGGAALSAWLPAWAQTISPGMRPQLPTVSCEDSTRTIARQSLTLDVRQFRGHRLRDPVAASVTRIRRCSS
ncbi:twin-arginine translocation signal domain-containing protein, partial [Sphingomonas koreensis]|uniref:twin-arginine translocation signal domain-containing protein n=1 Tax=Sphingomonas koreensis TaxID=93064 RepID=UPI000F7EFDFA